MWDERRARWKLPLVIIVIIVVVATVDHIGARRISEVDAPIVSDLVGSLGGTALVNLDRPWDGLNPGTPGGANSSTATLLSSVLPSAFTVSPNQNPVLNGTLLESVEVTTTTPLTIQYVINPAAVWSDGVPVNAADFIYAWHSQRGDGVDVDGQPDHVASNLGYRDIASVKGTKDGKTVTVVFNRPFTDWRLLFRRMIPAHIAERVGWNRGFRAFDPALDLSAGPFVLQSVSTGGTATLVRNPKWWGRRARLQKVTVRVVADQRTWTSDLAANDQTVFEPSTFDEGTLVGVSSMPDTESVIQPSLSFSQLEFNVDSPATSDLAVRQAIAHAINRPTLLRDAVGAIEPSIAVSDDHLAVPTQTAYQASSAATEYDSANLIATGRLMASAGYHKSGANYVDAGGSPLHLTLGVESADPLLSRVATEMVGQLQSAGFLVSAVPVNGVAGLVAASEADGYDLVLDDRTASPYLTTTVGWYSEQLGSAGQTGSADWSNFDSPDVDQLFSQAAQDLNPVTGGKVYAQIDDILWDQMVALPLFQAPAFLANGVQVANVQYNPSSDGLLWNLAQWTALVPRRTSSG